MDRDFLDIQFDTDTHFGYQIETGKWFETKLFVGTIKTIITCYDSFYLN